MPTSRISLPLFTHLPLQCPSPEKFRHVGEPVQRSFMSLTHLGVRNFVLICDAYDNWDYNKNSKCNVMSPGNVMYFIDCTHRIQYSTLQKNAYKR